MSAVPVTQEDRDAAAAFYGPYLARPGEVLVTAHMRAGKIDESPLIQAFAAHRAAEQERCMRIIAGSWTLDTRAKNNLATVIRGSESNG